VQGVVHCAALHQLIGATELIILKLNSRWQILKHSCWLSVRALDRMLSSQRNSFSWRRWWNCDVHLLWSGRAAVSVKENRHVQLVPGYCLCLCQCVCYCVSVSKFASLQTVARTRQAYADAHRTYCAAKSTIRTSTRTGSWVHSCIVQMPVISHYRLLQVTMYALNYGSV